MAGVCVCVCVCVCVGSGQQVVLLVLDSLGACCTGVWVGNPSGRGQAEGGITVTQDPHGGTGVGEGRGVGGWEEGGEGDGGSAS